MAKKKKKDQLATKRPGGSWMQQSATWEVYDVMIAEGWDKEGALVTVLVSRQSPRSGKIGAAMFLVDLGCLGIKDASVQLFKSQEAYEEELLEDSIKKFSLIPTTLDHAAKVVDTGLNYAAQLGFKPAFEYEQAKYLLMGASPEQCAVEIPTGGPEGKPLFVAGPYDNPEKIIATLQATVGEGNFHYVIPVG